MSIASASCNFFSYSKVSSGQASRLSYPFRDETYAEVGFYRYNILSDNGGCKAYDKSKPNSITKELEWKVASSSSFTSGIFLSIAFILATVEFCFLDFFTSRIWTTVSLVLASVFQGLTFLVLETAGICSDGRSCKLESGGFLSIVSLILYIVIAVIVAVTPKPIPLMNHEKCHGCLKKRETKSVEESDVENQLLLIEGDFPLAIVNIPNVEDPEEDQPDDEVNAAACETASEGKSDQENSQSGAREDEEKEEDNQEEENQEKGTGDNLQEDEKSVKTTQSSETSKQDFQEEPGGIMIDEPEEVAIDLDELNQNPDVPTAETWHPEGENDEPSIAPSEPDEPAVDDSFLVDTEDQPTFINCRPEEIIMDVKTSQLFETSTDDSVGLQMNEVDDEDGPDEPVDYKSTLKQVLGISQTLTDQMLLVQPSDILQCSQIENHASKESPGELHYEVEEGPDEPVENESDSKVRNICSFENENLSLENMSSVIPLQGNDQSASHALGEIIPEEEDEALFDAMEDGPDEAPVYESISSELFTNEKGNDNYDDYTDQMSEVLQNSLQKGSAIPEKEEYEAEDGPDEAITQLDTANHDTSQNFSAETPVNKENQDNLNHEILDEPDEESPNEIDPLDLEKIENSQCRNRVIEPLSSQWLDKEDINSNNSPKGVSSLLGQSHTDVEDGQGPTYEDNTSHVLARNVVGSMPLHNAFQYPDQGSTVNDLQNAGDTTSGY
jgi:hypothetical protein